MRDSSYQQHKLNKLNKSFAAKMFSCLCNYLIIERNEFTGWFHEISVYFLFVFSVKKQAAALPKINSCTNEPFGIIFPFSVKISLFGCLFGSRYQEAFWKLDVFHPCLKWLKIATLTEFIEQQPTTMLKLHLLHLYFLVNSTKKEKNSK